MDFAGPQLPRVLQNVCDPDCVKSKRAEIRHLLLKLRNMATASSIISRPANADGMH